MASRPRGFWVLGLALLAIAFAGAAARAASLDGFHVTFQFQGHLHTVWSFPGTVTGDDGCYVSTESGSGSQTMDFNMHGNRAAMRIVDAGGSIAFQLPTSERAGPHHLALGFRGADASRVGNQKTVFHKSVHWDSGCYPEPQEQFANTAGCGDKHVPWDAVPIDSEGRFRPEVFPFLPNSMLTECPAMGPSDVAATDTFPTAAQTHVALSELRHVLGKRHGKLIIHGQHRWHTEDKQGDFEVTATTTIHWKVILIRAHP